MRVLVASHPSSLEHDTTPNHPERPARIGAVIRGIDESGLDVEHVESPEILRAELALVHDPEYIAMIETFCQLGGGALDMDTLVSPGSWEAALTAAGGVAMLIRALNQREDTLGFAVTRPPGHHALKDRAMGFCVFNNVAISAKLLRSQGQRVAILDWDVHHGNGTQTMVQDDSGILYVSLHRSDFYPFSGEAEDIDAGAAKGTTVNIPLPAGTAGDVYRDAWTRIVLPVVGQFDPDWALISSGYDAHVNDPLGGMGLIAEDFAMFASSLARLLPASRTVVALEGGYDLDALSSCAMATVQGFGGARPQKPPLESAGTSHRALDEVAATVSRHWSL